MLAGRESLIRLVGKRRRDLPRDLLLKPPQQHQSPGRCSPAQPESTPVSTHRNVGDKDLSFTPSEDCTRSVGEATSSGSGYSETVECPVCGKPIRGSDYMVNTHIDLCLVRGKKRKLTQRTLLQLNFCKKADRKTQLSASATPQENSQITNDRAVETDNDLESEHQDFEDETVEIPEQQCLQCPAPESASVDILSESMANSNDTNRTESLEDPSNSPLSEQGEVIPGDALRTLSTTVLKTHIVGRKFHKENEVSQADSIFILRDPKNEKDQQALKVAHTVDEPAQILGYLPRELARYLSPLIDKCNLKFKGSVISVPDSLDAVPIEISCSESFSSTGMEQSDIQQMESLWSNALRVVKCKETYSTNNMRYQQNFLLMIQEVLNCYSDLFSDDEKSLLAHFQSISNESQRLFIRLYTRKGPWFRVSNISYTEITDLNKAIEELRLAGFFCSFSSLSSPDKKDLAEILDVLNVSELREISSLFLSKKGISNGKKQDMINWLYESLKDGRNHLLLSMISERTGACVKIPSVVELLLWRIQRLFFLNGEQDLSSFLLVDLGMVKYPNYTCVISHAIFQNRKELLAYEEALSIAQIMDESIEENNVENVIRCIQIAYDNLHSAPEPLLSFLSCFSTSHVYSKVVTLGISFYEHERRYEDAVKLLKGLLKKIPYGRKRGYWYFRLSLDLEHIGCVNESLVVAEEGILDPWVRAGSRVALQRRILRLGKPPRRWKSPSFAKAISRKIKEVRVSGRPLNCETGTKSRYYGYDGMQCGVEELALQYYAGEGGGWTGVHSESGIWLTLFGLLMWDIIFSNVPDVFRTRFQTAPLDLDTDSFYPSREDLVEAHLQKFHAGMAEEILICSWEMHCGTACRGINWECHTLSDLRAVVSCIGGHRLASFCRHLAQDYRSWSRGMPDLLLWRFHAGDMNGEAKLVEVKGPRDRLSEQQRAWMLLLMECGFEAEVCKVSATPQT